MNVLDVIAVTELRKLPISAASGLVVVGDFLHVVADDALHLTTCRLSDANFLCSTRLLDGELPRDAAARKKVKPDFESLALLPPTMHCAHGTLLAVGSGSTARRQQAVLLSLAADGSVSHVVQHLDFSALYAALSLPDCNIEGAVVCGDDLVLLQRANAGQAQNILIRVPLAQCLSPLTAAFAPQITHCVLPTISGVPLGFTDGTLLPNGNILFSAVAENTSDSYNDGECVGAAIGEITLAGELLRCRLLARPHKIEGIALDATATALYAVTDADDPDISAQLLQCENWQ